MKTRIAAVATALVLGVAPVSSAMASPNSQWSGFASERHAPSRALGVHDDPRHTACPMSSAAEGNANQQHFPVKQYGQVSGGYRC